jgi:hypothetical protein
MSKNLNDSLDSILHELHKTELEFSKKFHTIEQEVTTHSKILDYMLGFLSLDQDKILAIQNENQYFNGKKSAKPAQFIVKLENRLDFIKDKLKQKFEVTNYDDVYDKNAKQRLILEINEFVIRLRLILLKDQVNLNEDPIKTLLQAVASRFKSYVDCEASTIEIKNSDQQLKYLNDLFTGSMYQGKHSEKLIKHTYEILTTIIDE